MCRSLHGISSSAEQHHNWQWNWRNKHSVQQATGLRNEIFVRNLFCCWYDKTVLTPIHGQVSTHK